jgi:methionyl-tRNA formyltransferase
VRVVCFGTTGVMSLWPMQALAKRHQVLALVRPAPAASSARLYLGAAARWMGARRRDPLESWAVAHGIPLIAARSGSDMALAARLRALEPDLLCISTFRWLLAPEICAIPRLGAVNLHSSLLPRHRGPVPLFWIYYHDDRETGVTVHRATGRADAGDILLQSAFPLPRGFSVESLNEENARRGAALLAEAVDALASGTAREAPQDDGPATWAPVVRRDRPMVRFEEWDVERVWHFLAGLYPRFLEPLRSTEGPVRYGGVEGYEVRSDTLAPGTVVPAPGGWSLHCRGGIVSLRAER